MVFVTENHFRKVARKCNALIDFEFYNIHTEQHAKTQSDETAERNYRLSYDRRAEIEDTLGDSLPEICASV